MTGRKYSGAWFWGEIKAQKKLYQYAALASLMANIFAFSVSLFSMVVYDRILPNAALDSLYSLLFGVLLLLLLDYFVRQVRSELLDYAGKKIDLIISEKLFKEIILRENNKAKSSSGVSASIVREFDSLKEFLASATITTFVDIPFSLLFLWMIFLLSSYLVLVPLVSIFILLLLGWISHRQMRDSAKTMQGLGHGKQSIMFECLGAKETINCLGKDEFFSAKWQEATVSQNDQAIHSKSVSNRATNWVNLITQLNQIALISVGVLVSSLTGSLVAATLMAGRAIAPFSQVVNLLTRLSQAIQSYKTISQILDQEKKSTSTGAIDANNLDSSLIFENITISYAESKSPTVENLYMRIEPGDRVAILGRTGSGKTTLIKALLGLVPVNAGHIRLGGVDVRDLDRDTFLARFGILLQETHLFKDSVARNITLQSGLIDGENIMKACEKSGFSDVLKKLPEGLSTDIGEGGQKLSGGQRRLLAIARMLYEDKSHIIMDEPTSGLDQATEMQVIDKLNVSLEGKTVIFVTHRPAPLRLANKIAVIENGKLIEYGLRDEVIKKLQSNAANQRSGS
jgi:ATP-binding cassette subfamily C protein LapB